jgi:UDP-glucose 4-epimerase
MIRTPVLVVGAGGFIGSHTAKRILSSGNEVHCHYHCNASRLPADAVKHQADLLDREQVHRLVRSTNPRLVLNFAQPSPQSLRQCPDIRQHLSWAMEGLVNLLDACLEAGVERVVHACSSTVYANTGHGPLHEGVPLVPQSTRGLCKLVERNICLYYAGQGSTELVLGRVFRAYGPDDRPGKLLQKALGCQQRGLPVKLPAQASRRDYVYIDDVTDAFLRLSSYPLKSGEEVNIGTGHEHTPEQVLDLLEQITGKAIDRLAGAYPATDLEREHWRADIGKAERLLDWRPRVTLEAGLQRTVDWFLGVSPTQSTEFSGG